MAVQHPTLRANAIKRYWMEAGGGPPVMPLHGFPGAWHAWRKRPAVQRRERPRLAGLRLRD